MRYFLLLLINTFSFAQEIQKVDFIKMNAIVTPNAIEKSISGEVTYDFKVLSIIDTIKIDAQKMEFTSVKLNDKEVKFKNTGKQLHLFEGFKKGKNILKFSYKVTPKQTLYFIGENNSSTSSEQIWTQGQGKYTSHWLPSFDDVNEKVIFNLSINFKKDFKVISNGKLTNVNQNLDFKTWQYQMKKPMSSYLVMLAIGKFDKKNFKSKSNIPIELYLKPDDATKFESTYKYSAEMFDFLEKEIGVKYPWKIYKQVPVNDFLYAGMENTSATIFSQDYVVDDIGFNDRNYINVNAHELAHQWFGNLVTATSGKDHWLQEGFATYYSLLAEKELFGEDHFNFEMLKMANELAEASKTDLIPVMNEKASSLSFYKKGAWALYVLSESIGHEKFQKAVKIYLKKYQFKNVTTNDFLAEIKKFSNYDVENFKKVWLEKSGFETQVAIELLSKNKSIKEFFDLQKMLEIPFLEKKLIFENILKSNAFYPIKQEVIYQLTDVSIEDKKDLLQMAMQSDNVQIRQAVAETLQIVPLDFKTEYESLLGDKSYRTREIVLTNLCQQFPTDVSVYLNQSQNWIGFNNRNLRIDWLSIALKNPNYESGKQLDFLSELINYTSVNFDSSIRQNALEALLILNPENEKVLQSLVNATTHHKWQFVKFGKDNIRLLIKDEKFRKLFQDLIPKLAEKEKMNLEKLSKE
ncbi:M1 family metallopeptidase [Flavobacterium sp.]|uniref:M1 family metallopeptidase n=1 Tax=Flavobacterium sp. TaxID=239 RepID=UPI00286CABA6|nr:M1 family metallopeptidase [Flavobacterium sp.]